jgi:hypothetical protein
MITKQALDSIGEFIKKTAPDQDFLLLLAPKDRFTPVAIVSTLPREDQPLFAVAFAQAALGIKTGEFAAVDPNKIN